MEPSPDYTYLFDGSRLIKFDEPEPLTVDRDWNVSLALAGLTKHFDLGNQECAGFEIEVYNGPPAYPWCVFVMASGKGLGQFVCPDLPRLLIFLREWIAPLVAMRRDVRLEDFVDRAEEILFDTETGLEVAQDYGRARASERRRMLDERERREREKGKPEKPGL